MLFRGGVVILIFPAIISHLFLKGRGAESLNNIQSSSLVERLKAYMGVIGPNLFGNMFEVIILVIALLIIMIFFKKNINEHERGKYFSIVNVNRYMCILVPAVCYVFVVAKSAPYITNRYVYSVYAVLIAGVWSLICNVIKNSNMNELTIEIVFAVFVGIFVITSLVNCKWDYLYQNCEERLTNAQRYGYNAEAIVLYDWAWKINPYYKEIESCANSSFFCTQSSQECLSYLDNRKLPNTIALFVIGFDAEELINGFTTRHPEYNLMLDNGPWAYGHSYYFMKE